MLTTIHTSSETASDFWLGKQSEAINEQGRIEAQLANFEPIQLAQMERVALQDRYEVKYLFHVTRLGRFLEQLVGNYKVLVVEGHRLNRYQTLYFDTADFALYHRHHMGARNRYKVRSREYMESGYTFLEIKHKTNKKRTVKKRMPTSTLVSVIEGSAAQFLDDKCPYQADQLTPRLWNRYQRITLVNKHENERVTLDIDLSYAWGEQSVGVPALVVAEVKQPARSCPSFFCSLMRQNGVRKASFSKYCVGVSLLYPQVKHNKFKTTYRLLSKLVQGSERGEKNVLF